MTFVRSPRVGLGLLVALFAVSFTIPAHADAITLAQDGKTNYTIVTGDDASPAEQTAARDLAEHLYAMTGARFAVKKTADGDGPKILVGPSALAKKLSPETKWDALGTDGMIVKTVGKDLILAGGRPRGTLYAVYSFLEDNVGVRWWTSSESEIPKKPTLQIESLDKTYIPKLLYREAFYEDAIGNKAQHASFDARLKLNGHMSRIPEQWGGHYTIIGWCHTFYGLIPPAKYYKDHPEWFSLVNGKRIVGGAQLCLTNEEMRKELVKNALELIRKDPDAGIISITQNDCGNPCQCDKCQAIVKREGAESGPLIEFVNKVAADIHKEYPNFLVETLAYQYTRRPPKTVKPADNVLVRLCSIEADFAHPLRNEDFGRDLQTWGKLAKNLFIWNYVTDFANYLQPHPNMTYLGDDLRLFVDNNVVGVFEQGDAYNKAGDFLQLRTWLLAHLMWDPSRDQKSLVSEFLEGYYGAAAPHLQAYLDLINEPAAKRTNWGLSTYNGDLSFFPLQAQMKANELFDAAEDAVKSDAKKLQRVQRERLGLRYLALQNYAFDAKLADKRSSFPTTRAAAESVAEEYRAQANQFFNDADKFGFTFISEGGSFESAKAGIRMRPDSWMPPELPKAGTKLEPGQFDIQQDQLFLYGKGKTTEIVDDPKASDGKAARMTANHTEWAIQLHLKDTPQLNGPGPWKCYIVARIDPKAKAGGAFQYGLHDNVGSRYVARSVAPIQGHTDGEYHTYGIMTDTLTPTMYFWVAPIGDGHVNAIYVDRIYIVRGKK
ncbi:MAG TPA: DUF4838 domain-containing protein [Tepidisphaeraceae bacterium]|nr:DUF4838 domain-containing protein [Tepidisphaeraceae bacterium]